MADFTKGHWEVITAQNGYPYEPTKEDFLRYCSDCWDDSERVDASGDGWGAVRSEPLGVVICVFGNGPTTVANARLIAAAPELYEALTVWMEFFDTMPKGQFGKICCDIGLMNEGFLKSRAALARARGEK